MQDIHDIYMAKLDNLHLDYLVSRLPYGAGLPVYDDERALYVVTYEGQEYTGFSREQAIENLLADLDGFIQVTYQ